MNGVQGLEKASEQDLMRSTEARLAIEKLDGAIRELQRATDAVVTGNAKDTP